MNKQLRIFLAVVFLAAIAVAGILVNRATEPYVAQEKPILIASCQTEWEKDQRTQVALIAYHWLEADENGNAVWENRDYSEMWMVRDVLNPISEKITLKMSRPGEPVDITILRYEDYYFDLTALGAVCPEGEKITADWVQKDEGIVCEIPAAESSIYVVTVRYGESHASFAFGTVRPEHFNSIGFLRLAETGPAGTVYIDPAEWITTEDTERIAELGIEDDMPGGFYVYNPVKEEVAMPTTEGTLYRIIGLDGVNPVFVDWDGFKAFVTSYRNMYGEDPLCRIEEGEAGALIFISQQYLP